MFNLQANAYDISAGIKTDLDMEMSRVRNHNNKLYYLKLLLSGRTEDD